MDRKTLLRNIGEKLRKIREPLRFSHLEMADGLNAGRSSYTRYESGETAPRVTVLYKLGKDYGISLDWLFLDNGPMYLKEKEEITGPASPPSPKTLQAMREDVEELIEHMERIPLLHYEVLALFHRFKEDRKKMVQAAMKGG